MRYFIGFVVTIGLIILLIVLLFGGGGGNKVPNSSKPLTSYATTDAVAKLTIDGPINNQQQHQQVQISVDNTQVLYEQLQGYDGSVVAQKTYGSSQNAYYNFLAALGVSAGFTKGNTSSALSDERGYCPSGDRYVLELTQDGKDVERFWATNCGGTKTYGGSLNLTLSLFKAQVPDYNTLIQSLSL